MYEMACDGSPPPFRINDQGLKRICGLRIPEPCKKWPDGIYAPYFSLSGNRLHFYMNVMRHLVLTGTCKPLYR